MADRSHHPLLEHVIDITAHRDRTLVATAVINALSTLTDSSKVRLLDFANLPDGVALRQKVWMQEGRAVAAEEKAEWNQPDEALECFPGLEQGIKERRSVVTSGGKTAAGHQLWLLVWLNDEPISCIEICSKARLTAPIEAVAEGLMNVYQNFQSLLDYSQRDSLTGLFNRKTFDDEFIKIASQADVIQARMCGREPERRRSHHSKDQWLAVVDIDHFKKVNDEYGHLYGDEVLILVANLLKSAFRPHDRVFRFGGEEFVIMLHSVTLKNAYHVFERFRQRVEDYPFPQIGRITVSLGFVHISSDTPVVILGQADQALYYAKTNGRNQVCYYDDLVANGLLQAENSVSSVEFF